MNSRSERELGRTGSPDVTSDRQIIDVFLAPGEFFFGDADTRIRTILGSCVAITLWHPVRRIGGMCHYMLPTRGESQPTGLDGRYGDEAIELFGHEVRRNRSRPSEYEVKVFGGGNMFPDKSRYEALAVGLRNISVGLELLQKRGFTVKARHLAGIGHRNIVFEAWTGDVWLKHVAPVATQPGVQ